MTGLLHGCSVAEVETAADVDHNYNHAYSHHGDLGNHNNTNHEWLRDRYISSAPTMIAHKPLVHKSIASLHHTTYYRCYPPTHETNFHYRPLSCGPLAPSTGPHFQPASSCIGVRPRQRHPAVGRSALHAPEHHTATIQAEQDHDSNERPQSIWLGYPRALHDRYLVGQLLGSGGNGTVHIVRDRTTGEEFACKSIPKTLQADKHSPAKVAGHLDAVRREIEVLTRLRGTLNVVAMQEVLEDANSVHLIMELCRGGELWHRIGDRHYSERTVASFMRAVLRTIAQCHSHNILHRDIKPGNFLMLHQGDRAPLKAIDFGLAVFFDPAHLPRSDLGLEGTPWFMAPEVLSSQVLPASDVWSAGVMAFQLLTGRFPYDDRTNPHNPALSQIW